jgi:acyl dehydratase
VAQSTITPLCSLNFFSVAFDHQIAHVDRILIQNKFPMCDYASPESCDGVTHHG